MSSKPQHHRTIAAHRKAKHEYEIEETFEAGLVLTGTEVKSLRGGKGTINEAFVRVENGEAWVLGMHIPEYVFGNINNHPPRRPRKLLLKGHEIERIRSRVEEKGFACVPIELYWSGSKVKLEIGLGKGKKLHDKRRTQKDRDDKRDIERAMSRRR
jgi:SsrA-binding protein